MLGTVEFVRIEEDTSAVPGGDSVLSTLHQQIRLMTKDNQDETNIRAAVASELEQSKQLAKQFDLGDIKSGEWFLKLLTQVVRSYEKNARAEYFLQKYPGLPADDIADKLIETACRYAGIAGAVTGVVVTANQIALLGSAGMTIALFAGSIGAELIYLTRLQIRLALDLAAVYDLQLDPDDPEDILMIFGYAMGIAPHELISKGLQTAASTGTRNAIRTHISKSTLKAVQDFARQLGFKILQRDIIKFTVPVASAAVGSSYNYITTRSIGKLAKKQFGSGAGTEELRMLVSRRYTYDLIFPAAVMYMANVDGEYHPTEKILYRQMISRMSFDGHDPQVFNQLIKDENSIMQAVGKIEETEAAELLLELLTLMAIYDGKLTDQEEQFLQKVARHFDLSLDSASLEARAATYRVEDSSVWHKAGKITGSSLRAVREARNNFNILRRRD